MTPLAIFDIDGTLCDTTHVDEECFLEALSDCLGADAAAMPWQSSPHMTDGAITEFLWMMHHGRGPRPDEVHAVIDRFVNLLERALRKAPLRFRAVAGAAAILKQLATTEGWSVAVATGGWGRSARLKLNAAGLAHMQLLGSSDDCADRVEIFRLAHERAAAAGDRALARTLLVGDGVWDAQVAARMGWAFLGVGTGAGAHRLTAAGASDVVGDFSDGSAVLDAMARCRVPRSP